MKFVDDDDDDDDDDDETPCTLLQCVPIRDQI